jgi:hypothetical protein
MAAGSSYSPGRNRPKSSALWCARDAPHKAERRVVTTKTVRETEAEAVAFVVGTSIGLDTGHTSADFIFADTVHPTTHLRAIVAKAVEQQSASGLMK